MDISAILVERNMNKSQLANKLGVFNQNLNKMLSNPTESTIRRIADALGVPVWRLFENEQSGAGNAEHIQCDDVEDGGTSDGEDYGQVPRPKDYTAMIKHKIRMSGLSLKDVGERMPRKMSQQSLSALLKDGANPSIGKLSDIADVLGMSLFQLLAPVNSSVGNNCGADVTQDSADAELNDLVAFVRYKGRSYEALTLPDLERIVAELKSR